jgi:hypothetical protein
LKYRFQRTGTDARDGFTDRLLKARRQFVAANAVRGLGIIMIVLAAAANEFLVVRLFSADGSLESSTLFTIRLIQGVLAVSGISLFFRKRAAFRALIVILTIVNLAALRARIKILITEEEIVTEGGLPELHRALPPRTHVGYISDEIPKNTGNVGTKRFYLTQYAVVPVVVELGTNRKLVIGNFSRADLQQIPDDLVVGRDFGNGLMLLNQK